MDTSMTPHTSFIARSHHRFAVHLTLHYLHKEYVGKGQLTNVSLRGWRVEGRERVSVGDILTFGIPLGPQDGPLVQAQAVVKWTHGHAFGVELQGRQSLIEKRLRNWVTIMTKRLLGRPPLPTG